MRCSSIRNVARFHFRAIRSSRREYATALIDLRRGTRYQQDFADAAVASLQKPNDAPRVAGWIRNFLNGCAPPARVFALSPGASRPATVTFSPPRSERSNVIAPRVASTRS